MTYNEKVIDDLLHKIEKQNQKIGDMQKEIERLHKVFDIKDDARIELVKENKELQRIINVLQSDLEGATNDYKQAVNEVKLLNKQCDKLIAENNDLKHRRKILVKHLLNIMYGFDYADTDSEDKNADKKCTYKETGCGSCKWQLDCPIEADKAESEDK